MDFVLVYCLSVLYCAVESAVSFHYELKGGYLKQLLHKHYIAAILLAVIPVVNTAVGVLIFSMRLDGKLQPKYSRV